MLQRLIDDLISYMNKKVIVVSGKGGKRELDSRILSRSRFMEVYYVTDGMIGLRN
jgi:hypothetical protein